MLTTDREAGLIGQRIGVYEIRSRLGVGGMGEVPAGYLVFARSGRLMMAPFDLERLEMTGAPALVLET